MWKEPLTEEQIKNFLYRGFIADIENYNFKLIPDDINKTYIDCIRRPLEEYGRNTKSLTSHSLVDLTAISFFTV